MRLHSLLVLLVVALSTASFFAHVSLGQTDVVKVNTSLVQTDELPGREDAASPRAVPDITAQIQIFRDSQPVVTMAARKIQLASVTDITRLPYGADISLDKLQPGRYILEVTVFDRLARTTASQRFRFQVD